MVLKRKIVLILSIAIIGNMMTSCGSKLPIYQVSNVNNAEIISEKYDSDAKIGYTVSKDDNNLYVNLQTTDTPNQIKMLNNGVTIYFDSEGKEEQETFVHFPVKKEITSQPDFETLQKDKNTYLNNLITGLSDKIKISLNGKQTLINKELNTEGISVSINANEEELNYQIKLPLNYLAFNSSQLPSLGISIEGIKKPANAQGNPNGGRPAGVGGGRPAGAGGGRPAGVGGGRPSGSGGGRPSGNSSAQSPVDGLSNAIKIWFQLEMKPKS